MLAPKQSFSFIGVSTTAKAESRKFLYLAVCICNMLVFCAGISLVWSAPVLLKLSASSKENPFKRTISADEASWIASLVAIGGSAGTYIASWFAAKIGRKKSLIILCIIPFTISFLILSTATSIHLYYVARFLSGISVTSVFTVVPLYNGEIAENSNRGLILSSMATFQTGGQLFTFCLAHYMSIHNFSLLCIVISLTNSALFLAVLPESPYYLVSVKNMQAAEKSLVKLRATVGTQIINELNSIRMVIENYVGTQKSVVSIFQTRSLRKAQKISMTLILFQTFSGMSAVLFYSHNIFAKSGTSLPPEICAMVFAFVQFISSIIMPSFVDRLGRRWMLSISAFGMCFTEALLALYLSLDQRESLSHDLGWLPIMCLVLCSIAYVLGLGPLVWTVMAEIFPNNVKEAAASMVVLTSWISTFVLTKLFVLCEQKFGMSTCFWLFAVSCACAGLFSRTYLIETKGKTYQEIQQLLRK